jgi:hypothetical protein
MNGGMLMKSASVIQLLKIGHFLFQKQTMFKNFLEVKYDFFKDEMNTILQIILIHMGIVRGGDQSIYVPNTDHYEYVTDMFWSYCKSEISEEEMIDFIHVLKMDEVQIIQAHGEVIVNSSATDSLFVFFELKNLLNLKRMKVNKVMDGLADFIRAEMKLVHVALEELDLKGY